MKFLSIPFIRSKTQVPKQYISDRWADRDHILSSEFNLFCWRRPIDSLIAAYLNKLAQEPIPNIKVFIGLSSLKDNLMHAREVWDPSFDENANCFWEDIARIAKDFLQMSAKGAGTLHLRLVENDACTKFHLDGYDLRLFSTYLGPGTEWLPENAVDRTALGQSNERIVKDPHLIEQMGPFEVGILKGEILKNLNHLKKTTGIVHRSPAIEKTGEKRIILRIDI